MANLYLGTFLLESDGYRGYILIVIFYKILVSLELIIIIGENSYRILFDLLEI